MRPRSVASAVSLAFTLGAGVDLSIALVQDVTRSDPNARYIGVLTLTRRWSSFAPM